MDLILASGSPRRAAILSAAGFSFKVVTSMIDETRRRGESAASYVQRLALEKAQAVAARVPRNNRRRLCVIGADTAVVVGRQIWGKPKSRQEVRKMLRRLSGRTHDVYTGVALISLPVSRNRQRQRVFLEKTRVQFDHLSEREIEGYVRTREPYDKAGAYAIQGQGAKFVRRIEGCYFNVMGLPLARLYWELQRIGYKGSL